jgi:ubiquinone/menaquinone biosynthesis C-methylase UbiE
MGALSTAAPDPVAYMDAAAALSAGQDYKSRLLDALELQPEHRVVDLGCGPGTDLGALATAAGWVLGVDQSASMLAEARRRLPTMALALADLHELPLAAGSVDRARADRVLQHVADPARVVAEVARVLRPGGRFGMAEPDWATLVVDDDDLGPRFAAFVAGQVRNPTIGRRLARLCVHSGLAVLHVEPVAVLFRDFAVADAILGLRRNTARAISAGLIAAADGHAFVERLAGGPLLAGFTFYLVLAQA